MDVAKIRETLEARLEQVSDALAAREIDAGFLPGMTAEIRDLAESLQRLGALQPPEPPQPALNVPQLQGQVWTLVQEQHGLSTMSADATVRALGVALADQGITP